MEFWTDYQIEQMVLFAGNFGLILILVGGAIAFCARGFRSDRGHGKKAPKK